MTERRTAAPAGGRLRIFISYRRQDAAPYAGRLYDDLCERFGEAHVFLDIDAIDAGADFEEVIVETIHSADVLLAIVGPLWITAVDEAGHRRLDRTDDLVRRELELALERNVRVIPLLVGAARMPARDDLPPSLAPLSRRQAVVMSDGRWRADLVELVAALEKLAARKASPPPGAGQRGRTASEVTPVVPPPSRSRPLPQHRTRFVGRDEDMKRVQELLAATGFVTITGPGGVGKSRLAIEAARPLEGNYEDGVHLAELASIDDPSLVVPALSTLVGGEGPERTSTVESLVERLVDRQVLLILDNCEHVIDEAAALVEALIQRCPEVHILATSREALQVDGEAVWRLAPLATPEPDRPLTAIDLTDYAAAVLFADRAALAAPSFQLDDEVAPAVAQIAVALDGLPLALELAAGSLRTLDLDELVGGLSNRFATLGAGRRTTQARQRTLWSMVDWSYELLEETERLVLERLGVFAGDFAASHAEQVCGEGLPPGQVARTVLGLVEHSLVDPVDHDKPGGRFRLLFTVRDYARGRLQSRPDDPTPGRLQAWAADIARTHGRAVDVGDELEGLRVLDAERPNLIAALTLAREASSGRVVSEIACSLAPYWELRGLGEEGRAWVAQALELAPPDDHAVRAACLLAAARLAATADFEGRRRLSAEALAAADRAGDDALAGAALASLGHIDFETEERESARRHLEASLARARSAGDDAGIALALERLAMCQQGLGSSSIQQELLGQATEIFRKLANRRGQLWCLAELGFAHLTTGDLDQAGAAFARGLALARELGYLHGEAWMLDALGETAVAAKSFAEARRHFEDAHTIQQQQGDELNRGWTLGGLIRTHLATGDLTGAVRWLEEFTLYLRRDVAPLYEYAFLLRAGCVAVAAGHPEHAAHIVGALDAMEAPASLSAVDDEDHRFLEEAIAGLGPEVRKQGTGVPPVRLAERLLDVCARPST